MSFRLSPKPDFRDYKAGSAFNGRICSIASAGKGLFYVLREDLLKAFGNVEHFQPPNAYTKPPVFGSIFLYKDPSTKFVYRAYRLNSNPANDKAIKAVLMDIGKQVYCNFTPDLCYKIPRDFLKFRAMAIFCLVESIPKSQGDAFKSDFLKESILQQFNFVVVRKTQLRNAIDEEEPCLVVNIRDISEAEQEMKEPEFYCNLQYSTELTYLDDDCNEHIPVMVDMISREACLPKPGSEILVFRTEILRSNCIFAHYKEPSQLTNDLDSKLLEMNMWMNNEDVVKAYQQMKVPPVVGEIVVAIGKDDRYHRALVQSVRSLTWFSVHFIDFGYDRLRPFKKLFKFPKQFIALPIQSVCLNIQNMIPLTETQKEAVLQILPSLRRAHVVDSTYKNSQPEMNVNLYDYDGNDVAQLLMKTTTENPFSKKF